MDGRGRAHRSKGIVRHQIDIVRLAPASDLHRLREPADIADIEPVELMDVALDIGQELPFAGKFLADGERDLGHPAQSFISFRGFVSDRLLKEIKHAAAELVAKACRLCHRKPMMIVYAEDDLVAQRFPRLVQHARSRADRLPWFKDVSVALPGGEKADRLPALCL